MLHVSGQNQTITTKNAKKKTAERRSISDFYFEFVILSYKTLTANEGMKYPEILEILTDSPG